MKQSEAETTWRKEVSFRRGVDRALANMGGIDIDVYNLRRKEAGRGER